MTASNSKIQFRLIHMICCTVLICWVNPRRPNYCPECGKRIIHYFPKAKWEGQYSEAWLRIADDQKAFYVCENIEESSEKQKNEPITFSEKRD